MPTPANTGNTSAPTRTMTNDEFTDTHECRNARMTEQLRVESAPPASTWTIENCILDAGFFWNVDGYTGTDLPRLTITSVQINGAMVLISAARVTMTDTEVTHGGFWAPCPDCAGTSFGRVIAMPVTVTDSLFHHPQGTPPEHTEALHVAGTGTGYRFTNTRFTQAGPINGTQTGALFFWGRDSTFDHCWFDYDDPNPATYYTVYATGTGNHITNSHIQRGITGYIYSNTDLGPLATYTGNRDFFTDQPITLP
jgi:hypothetical protein